MMSEPTPPDRDTNSGRPRRTIIALHPVPTKSLVNPLASKLLCREPTVHVIPRKRPTVIITGMIERSSRGARACAVRRASCQLGAGSGSNLTQAKMSGRITTGASREKSTANSTSTSVDVCTRLKIVSVDGCEVVENTEMYAPTTAIPVSTAITMRERDIFATSPPLACCRTASTGGTLLARCAWRRPPSTATTTATLTMTRAMGNEYTGSITARSS